jgi:hypothetical protein
LLNIDLKYSVHGIRIIITGVKFAFDDTSSEPLSILSNHTSHYNLINAFIKAKKRDICVAMNIIGVTSGSQTSKIAVGDIF